MHILKVKSSLSRLVWEKIYRRGVVQNQTVLFVT